MLTACQAGGGIGHKTSAGASHCSKKARSELLEGQCGHGQVCPSLWESWRNMRAWDANAKDPVPLGGRMARGSGETRAAFSPGATVYSIFLTCRTRVAERPGAWRLAHAILQVGSSGQRKEDAARSGVVAMENTNARGLRRGDAASARRGFRFGARLWRFTQTLLASFR